MATKLNSLICPNCGGRMQIDHKDHMLVCPYCDNKVILNGEGDIVRKRVDLSDPLWAAVLLILVSLLIFVVIAGYMYVRDHRTYDWPTTELVKELPKPYSPYGRVMENNNDSFCIEVYQMTADDCSIYVERCKEKGFVIDSKENWNYSAFNQEGYYLEVWPFSDDWVAIAISSPIELSTIDWAAHVKASALPKPKSDQGKVDGTGIYIGDTTMDDYEEYVKACRDAGFTKDMIKGEDYYMAESEYSKWGVLIEYVGYGMMKIVIYR